MIIKHHACQQYLALSVACQQYLALHLPRLPIANTAYHNRTMPCALEAPCLSTQKHKKALCSPNIMSVDKTQRYTSPTSPARAYQNQTVSNSAYTTRPPGLPPREWCLPRPDGALCSRNTMPVDKIRVGKATDVPIIHWPIHGVFFRPGALGPSGPSEAPP